MSRHRQVRFNKCHDDDNDNDDMTFRPSQANQVHNENCCVKKKKRNCQFSLNSLSLLKVLLGEFPFEKFTTTKNSTHLFFDLMSLLAVNFLKYNYAFAMLFFVDFTSVPKSLMSFFVMNFSRVCAALLLFSEFRSQMFPFVSRSHMTHEIGIEFSSVFLYFSVKIHSDFSYSSCHTHMCSLPAKRLRRFSYASIYVSCGKKKRKANLKTSKQQFSLPTS